MREFLSYEAGWDFGQPSEPLDVGCIEALNAFASEVPQLRISTPSLFMDRGGYLVVAWEDRDGARVEVDVRADGYALFSGDDDEEREMPSLDALLHAVSPLLPLLNDG